MVASSGTIGATVVRVADVVETIARRCGIPPEKLTPESIDIVMGSLWRILGAMSNRGVNLWRLYSSLYALYPGQQRYTLQQGDIDVQRLVHRQPQRLSASSVSSSAGGTINYLTDGDTSTVFTQTGANGNVVFDWGSDNKQQVALAGVLSSVARSYNLVFEKSDDGATYTSVLAPGSVAYTAGGWNWYEIEPPGTPARYFRVRETGGAILSIAELSLAAQWTDVDVSRWSLDQWTVNPSKRSTGAPRQFYLDRQITPIISAWPVPNSGEALNLLVAWVHRHIEDVGTMQQALNIPQRWYQPIIDVASFTCLPELPNADLKRYDMLKDIVSNMTLPDAEKEESDKSAMQFAFAIGPYTR